MSVLFWIVGGVVALLVLVVLFYLNCLYWHFRWKEYQREMRESLDAEP